MIDFAGGFLLSVCTWASVNKARMDHECSTDPIKLASPVLRFRYIRFANTICLPSRKLPGDIVDEQEIRKSSYAPTLSRQVSRQLVPS